MENKELMKQMVGLYKTSFDNSFNMLAAFQDQMEKMVHAFNGQAPWLPAESKEALNTLIGSYKTGREDFKKLVDEAYEKVEQYVK
jgi:hypothetical protein